MKKIILLLTLTLVSFVAFSQTPQYVKGYYKSNGTYVSGYYRTVANNTVTDNYTTKGNINPYTGQKGTRTYYNSYNSRNSYSYRRRR
jgi:hypothetical protein